MNYILDTNICIHILRNKSFSILKYAKRSASTSIFISSITEAELWTGVWKSEQILRNKEILENFLASFESLPFNRDCAETYGETRAFLEKSGKRVGGNDLLIAAQALELDAILVTDNTKEFKNIKDLRVENWLRAKP